MPIETSLNHSLRPASLRHRHGLTLLEMLVAVTILAIVILCIGMIFQSTTKAVGTSQALLETMSNARSIQDQLSRDVASIDKSGFLIIRSSTDPTTGERSDQMAFLALGSFTDPANGTLSTNAAHIWWGELCTNADTSTTSQSTPIALNASPTSDTMHLSTVGRHATLLMAKDASNPPGAFQDIRYDTSPVGISSELSPAHITESRFNCAAITPSQVMSWIRTKVGARGSRPGSSTFEADNYCYRFNALRDVQASRISIVNGFSRMMPIALQGVSNFRIEWVEGGSGEIAWHGAGSPKSPTPTVNEPVPAPASGDDYLAIFSFDSARDQWPSALRISFRLSDPNGRLQGGRTFVQVMKLPD